MEIILLTSISIILLVISILALPYLRKTIPLKKIKASDLPSHGSWVNLSRGNIYYRWYKSEATEEEKEVMVLVHGFSGSE